MKVPFTFKPGEYAMVFLGDSEWGNDTMDRVAQEFFAANPTCEFVQVQEHAGWMLAYRRDGSIWNTANDMAVLRPGSRPESLAYVYRREPNQYRKVVQYPLVAERPALAIVA